MWQRFTERARRVVFFAQEEAGRLGHSVVDSEHLLLGLAREDDSVAMRVLDRMGISPTMLRVELASLPKGDSRLGQDMSLSKSAKAVIDRAYDEARRLKNNYLGTEHLLLGLMLEEDGRAAEIWLRLGIDIERVRNLVSNLQSGETSPVSSGPIMDWINGRSSSLKGKSLLRIADLSRVEINAIFTVTKQLKEHVVSPADQRKILEGKTLAMIFEKPSLRTRVSFETGISQLGGHGIYLGPSDISLGKRESVADIARTVGRMADIIMARVFAHGSVVGLAENAGVPVINGLCDLEHPCQALADFYTILEHKGEFEGLRLAFIGDGNNVAHSLMLLAAKVGADFAIGCPEGYEPDPKVVAEAKECALKTGATIEISNDPVEAAKDADVVYTDVWASMGQESEAAEREGIFAPFQVNSQLMSNAKPDAIFMHCLPAHRGSEVTDEVVDSPRSVVFDEAENRLHAQKAVMVLLAG